MQFIFTSILLAAILPSSILASLLSRVETPPVTPALHANLTGIISALNTTYTTNTNTFQSTLSAISSRNDTKSDDLQTVWQSNYVYQQAIAGAVAVALDATTKLAPGAGKQDLIAIRNAMASALIIQQDAGAMPFEQAYTVVNDVLGLSILE